jgi:hypothetical protein
MTRTSEYTYAPKMDIQADTGCIMGPNWREWFGQFRFPAIGVACISLLSACAGPAPAMRDSRTAVVSGRVTAGLSATDAARRALSEAAKITVDHGFRYFMIANPQNASASSVVIIPGVNLTIKTFRKGDVKPNTRGLWDADVILSSGIKDAAIKAFIAAPTSGPTATVLSR